MSLFTRADEICSIAGYEPQFQQNFAVEIGLPNEGNNLILSLAQAFAPESTLETIEVPYGNTVVNVPTRRRWSPGDLLLRDFVDRPTLKILMDWSNSVQNPKTGAFGLLRQFKRDASIILYAHNTLNGAERGGAFERVWTLKGCYPERVSPAANGLSHADANIVMIGVTLRYDWAEASGVFAPDYSDSITDGLIPQPTAIAA